jgi:predicted RNA-binding protein with PUA-like domain
MNYWIFQGNPEAYYFDSSVNQGLLNGWNVKKHIDKIKKGDKAIIWLCGKNAGCYGLADILSNPYHYQRDAEDLHLWNSNNETGERHQKEDRITKIVDVNLTHNFFTNGKHVPKDKLPQQKVP